ncbi:MAG: endonuclease/exonuclease/phosphatase family protein [Treponema sp.]|jgi:endonuclease/exonuclease/phosphatase family metal-dependent hydrolase|nr:endonuclease/exonuclease/phosphatase family protein [Treponema sp.]
MTHKDQQNNYPKRPGRFRQNREGKIGGIGLSLILLFLAGCDLIPEEPPPAANSSTAPEESSENSGSTNLRADNAGTFTVATWNIQALFDGTEGGTEYDEYRESAGWTEEKYRARVNSISQAISQMAANIPDVIALQETENSQVLEELAKDAFLSKYGYRWTFFANNPEASLGIGILSRFPLEETRVHSITRDTETTPRPVLEVRILPKNKPIVLFICHWKSKLGGDHETESLRRASARVILRRIREIRDDYKDMPIIVLGDLNENHDEFYRQAGSIICALLPDDPKAAELAGFTPDGEEADEPQQNLQMDFLILSKKKPPAPGYFFPEASVLYSPWGNELQDGSYYYKNAWETIDHFLLTESLFDNGGWEFDSSWVVKKEPFVNSQGYPNAYNPRTGNGLSDHLPLMLVLKDVEKTENADL